MRLTSKYTFLAGLLVILSSAVSLFLNHPGFALKLLTITFWIVSLGTIQYILELKNES